MIYAIGNEFFVIFFFFLIIMIAVIATLVSYFAKENKNKMHVQQERMHTKQDNYHKSSRLDKVASDKKTISSRKREDYLNSDGTMIQSAIKTEEEKLKKKEAELKKKEEELNDKEMALALGVEEIINLKNSVDQIIKEQKEELFSYCSVSEESALKMKEITLEVQKKLKETIEKIQE